MGSRTVRNKELPRCPFTVVVDTREQRPYCFVDIREQMSQRNPSGCRLLVSTIRTKLDWGDYSILGMPRVAIERKSKEDLYQSVSQHRENFKLRLATLGDPAIYDYAAVVVEADFSDIINFPPARCKLHPRNMRATLMSWDVRYGVKWWFVPGREWGELVTFRLLQKYYGQHEQALAVERDPHGYGEVRSARGTHL
jgi:ERCC4-type nuclease